MLSPKIIGAMAFSLLLASCVPEVGQTKLRTKSGSGVTSNTNDSVAAQNGRVLLDNPIILSKNPELTETVDLARYLSSEMYILNHTYLQQVGPCAGLTYCFEVQKDSTENSALQSSNKKWAFPVATSEFLEVNTFYHADKILNKFYENLYTLYGEAYDSVTTNNRYETAIPKTLVNFDSKFNFNWTSTLKYYADCGVENNALFDPANNYVCLGHLKKYPQIKMAQDSTVIYHETGHFLIKQLLNLRNDPTSGDPRTTYLGSTGSYEESSALGEGIADYYSYFMNNRSHVGEWALGRFLKQSRPISEDDALHPDGVGTDELSSRVSYPDFLSYDPNYASVPYEDVHYAGMIISHYLVAQTDDLVSQCGYTKDNAAKTITKIIAETLSELGDLNSKGIDNALVKGDPNTEIGRINANLNYSFDYYRKINPVNYRSFTQTFAKHFKNILSDSNLNLCNGTTYAKDRLESLLDKYGLLLFRTYNDHRNDANPSDSSVSNESVNPVNRTKTTLLKKSMIKLDERDAQPKAFVVDKQSQIQNLVSGLKANGIINDISPLIPSDFGYNNGNGVINRGEVFGLMPNLYNDSNVTMGGVQVLANDWDQVDGNSPCIFPTEDNWPLPSEGGVNTAPCSNKIFKLDQTNSEIAPVCFVQSGTSSSTQWITQTKFREKIALDKSLCLNSKNDKDCFLRVIKGADQANFSKINAKSNWFDTYKNPVNGKSAQISNNHLILFEVSKHIPPGTTFNCRMRVRFTNCDDCFHDSTRKSTDLGQGYDYVDSEYNGARPYKIIHFVLPIVN